MGKLILTDEEKVLCARVRDMLRKCDCENCPVFSDFLSDREKAIVMEVARETGAPGPVLFYGGYRDAERTLVGFFPEYCMYVDEADLYDEFPIDVLEIVCSGFREHTHRDFLGSVLGLGIERTVIGDIIVGEKGYSSNMIVHRKISEFLLENFRLVGRDGIKVSKNTVQSLEGVERNFELICGTVAGFRVDALLSEVLNISREKSVRLIEGGFVTINHMEINSKSEQVSEKDVFTVRGYGKYRLSKIGSANRKGRIRFEAEKFI